MTVVTRFAPSPTGFLHIGGARTALYCWLFARKMQGQFILRIEDTDTERGTPESVQAILDAMQWLNLDYDTGPFYQTKRLERYQETAALLLAENKAYRCFCSKERLEKLREQQMANKEKPRYDEHCRESNHPAEGSFVIRFKNPKEGTVQFHDLIRGTLIFNNAELDDLIIVRSDGMPTYNFTVVVDDWDMKITDVIRGDDHINNTPRQINILHALGATPPRYAHVPMILGPDGKRLSKRHGAVGVMQYREDGFLPEALLNYLVRLGWSHGDEEIFSREELIQLFDIKNVHKAAAAINPDKLLWLNQHYIKTGNKEQIAAELAWHMQRLGIDIGHEPSLIDILHLQQDRCKTLREMAEKSLYFYSEITLSDDLIKQHVTVALLPALQAITDALSILTNWQKESIHATMTATADQFQLKLGKIAQPLRIAVTGGTVSPSIDATLALLGKKNTIGRLKQFLIKINAILH